MFTFGPIPTYQGEVKFEPSLSDDKRALTLTFSEGATIEVGNSPTSAPLAARTFDLILPLEGDGGRAEIEFNLDVGVFLNEGTTATVMLSVNGQSAITDFLVDPDGGFLQRVNFAAYAPSECRVFALILIGKDSQNLATGGVVTFSNLNAEILPRSPQPTDPVL